MTVTAAGLELALALVAGSVPVEGVAHLPVPRVLLEHVLLLELLLLAQADPGQLEQQPGNRDLGQKELIRPARLCKSL